MLLGNTAMMLFSSNTVAVHFQLLLLVTQSLTELHEMVRVSRMSWNRTYQPRACIQ